MIFIDATPWIAAFVSRDQNHDRAQTGFRVLREQRPGRLYTSPLVLGEVASYFYWNAPKRDPAPAIRYAVERLREAYAWDQLTVLDLGRALELEALALFEKLGYRPISFADCTSFVLMRRLGIERVFTFDQHFSDAGFSVWSPD